MNDVRDLITQSQAEFRQRLVKVLEAGGLSEDQYARFLSMQYHLTKGVQRHFMLVAAHSDTAKFRELRRWLVGFAEEEEFHFEIARADLKAMGREPLEYPLDAKLWWLYYDEVIKTRPLFRLGATCILENITDGAGDVLDQMIKTSTFMNPKNLRFLTIHRHGPNLAHGDQVLEQLAKAGLDERQLADVLEGAQTARVFYMRYVHWIVTGEYAC